MFDAWLLCLLTVLFGVSGMPNKRSYYTATVLNEKQLARKARDEKYRSSPGMGRRFIPVLAEVREDVRLMVRAKELHFKRDSSNGHQSNDGWRASLASAHKIGPAQLRRDFAVYSAGNKGKHSHSSWPTLAESTPPSDCSHKDTPESGAVSSLPPVSGPCNLKKAWADITDSEVVDQSGSGVVASRSTRAPSSQDRVGAVEHKLCQDSFTLENATDFKSQNLAQCELFPSSRDRDDRRQDYWQQQVAQLRAENKRLFQEVAELRNENFTLYENGISLQQHLTLVQSQLASAESAMGVWASHATALEEHVMEQRHLLLAQQNKEVQNFHGASDQLQHGTGSGLRIDAAPNLSLAFPPTETGICEQLQGGAGSELKIDSPIVQPVGPADGVAGISFRVDVIEKRIDKLTRSLGSAVQTSLDKRCALFLTAESLQPQLDKHKDALANDLGKIVNSSNELLASNLEHHFVDRKAFQSVLANIKTDLDRIQNEIDRDDSTVKLQALSDALGALQEKRGLQKQEAEVGGMVRAQDLDVRLGDFVDKAGFHNVLTDIKVVFDGFKEGVERDLRDLRSQQQQVSSALLQAKEDDERLLSNFGSSLSTLRQDIAELKAFSVDRNNMISSSTSVCGASETQGAFVSVDCNNKDFSLTTVSGAPEAKGASFGNKLRVGDIVNTHSLQNRALNGQMGVITGYHKSKDRYSVRIAAADGMLEEKLFKACNLQADPEMSEFPDALAQIDREIDEDSCSSNMF